MLAMFNLSLNNRVVLFARKYKNDRTTFNN